MRVLIPLPDRDFDVTEVAVPWRILRDTGHQTIFATEQAGTLPAADPRLLRSDQPPDPGCTTPTVRIRTGFEQVGDV